MSTHSTLKMPFPWNALQYKNISSTGGPRTRIFPTRPRARPHDHTLGGTVAQTASAQLLDATLVLRLTVSVPEIRAKPVPIRLTMTAEVANALLEQLATVVRMAELIHDDPASRRPLWRSLTSGKHTLTTAATTSKTLHESRDGRAG